VNRDRWSRIVDRATLWIVAVAVFIAVLAVSWGVYQAAEAKSQAQQTRALMVKVRATQLENTKKTNHLIQCQRDADNTILFDAGLELQGDKNPADYKTLITKC
jgi:hypothetical protein